MSTCVACRKRPDIDGRLEARPAAGVESADPSEPSTYWTDSADPERNCSPMSKVKIQLNGKRGTVIVDGHDVSAAVASVAINADALSGHHVELRLATLDTEVDGEPSVGIPQRTHDALVALGWTPPVESA